MENLIAKNILENSARAALTHDKSLALVKPTYGFIDTSTIIDQFQAQGWQLSNASQAKVRKASREGHQKHMLRFRHPDFQSIKGLSGDQSAIPELIAVNSHDGTSALNIYFGIFRIACLNGIVAGASIASMRVIHSGNAVRRLHDSIDELAGRIPIVAESVERLTSVKLDRVQALDFASKACALRLAKTPHDVVDAASALRPKRMADTGTDLFSVFNVVQERVIRGGISYRTEVKRGDFDLKEWRKSRAVNSIGQSVKFNRELFDLAMSYTAA